MAAKKAKALKKAHSRTSRNVRWRVPAMPPELKVPSEFEPARQKDARDPGGSQFLSSADAGPKSRAATDPSLRETRRHLADTLPDGKKLLAQIEDAEASGNLMAVLDAEMRFMAAGATATGELTSSLGGAAPPVSSSLSTNLLRDPPDVPDYGTLEGGRTVNQRELHRAFTILMELMDEASDWSSLNRAKPRCVVTYATDFIDLMNGFLKQRQKEASWVKGQQIAEPFIELYRSTKMNWVERPSSVDGRKRLPTKPRPDEKAKIDSQRQELQQIAKGFGYNPAKPDVKKVIEECLATPAYITRIGGPKKAAYASVARFLKLDGESVGESAIEHASSTRSHIEKSAAQENFSFFISDTVPCVSATDVLNAQKVARRTRAYYLRYLMAENAKRIAESLPTLPILEGANVDDERALEISADRLGLIRSAYEPPRHAAVTTLELATWDRRLMGNPLPTRFQCQQSPYNFGFPASEG